MGGKSKKLRARELGRLESRTESKRMQAKNVRCAVETTEKEMRLMRRADTNGRLAETETHGYACRLVFGSGGETTTSSSLSSRPSECDRFLPRPRQVVSGYSHCLQRFTHCLHNKAVNIATSHFQKKKGIKELTGTCCPGDHRAEGGTESSADDRKDMRA